MLLNVHIMILFRYQVPTSKNEPTAENKVGINCNIEYLKIAVRHGTWWFQKRAVKLQQQKQKEALQREQARDRESELERQLTARPTGRLHRGRGSGHDSETSSSRES